ncbi:adenylyl-sulfate kinase [uncultured Brevundimonas sp.]|uniref:adenylyl-sulfate kinase n=1 Tax=uncultured Brevundimonas sp. TaxID=213418 RepID=UPI002608DFA9|nr:adenylyl-sulfate kinase [uncultured Brevundimonas sp.]
MDGEVVALSRVIPDPAARDHLRFLTCGSVDDGKSTLIGRLLYDTGQVADDQLAALERDSRRFGAAGDDLDFALLLDGLEAEREQGITIDVAHRYFSTARRNFIVADTPGHEQYTRNMATGASGCDAAVILVDATRGLTAQTERHSRIVSLFGIRHVILAVNKIDLVDYDPSVFDALASGYAAFAAGLAFRSVAAVPISARQGDNVVRRGPRLPWFGGPTLIDALEGLPVEDNRLSRPFRFLVQYVNRPDHAFRGYAGTVASGRLRAGDQVVVSPSGKAATVSRIVTWEGDRTSAEAGDAVTLVLKEEVDVARGDVLALPHARPASVERFSASLLWMDDRPFTRDRAYRIRIGGRTAPVRVQLTEPEAGAAAGLDLNEIAAAELTLSSPIAFDPFADDPAMGGFVLIDRETGAVAAAGVARAALGQAGHIYPTAEAVSRRDRSRLNGHEGGAIWLTGLPGSGKSTIATALELKLHARGIRTVLLDGDNLRHGLNRDLGFSPEDRAENVRRAGEVARLFVEGGVISLCAFVSPGIAARQAVRERMPPNGFLEVFVDAPLGACRARDPKGLYARADAGGIADLTGVGSPYEPPSDPDLVLDTLAFGPETAADRIIALLESRRWIPAA